MIEDPYRVLEVGAEATDAEIRRAFRRLARQLHPDLNPDDESATARFRLISEAYRVLLDPRERAEADRSGATAMPPDASATASVFQESGRKWARNGQDVVAVAKIDLVTSIGGGPVKVRVTGPVTCSDCAGSGIRRRRRRGHLLDVRWLRAGDLHEPHGREHRDLPDLWR